MRAFVERSLALGVTTAIYVFAHSADAAPVPEAKADIYWTDHGVPHIVAKNWYSLGYGAAYAGAQQNFCVLADQLLKIRSQRSQVYGPGAKFENVISDVGNLAQNYVEDGKALFSRLTPRAQKLIHGYAAGFNRYLKERAPEQYPLPCRGAKWVQPTTGQEMLAYYLSLAERASGQQLLPASFNAAPPAEQAAQPQAVPLLPQPKTEGVKKNKNNAIREGLEYSLPNFDRMRLGSNAWAIGEEMSENGNALLLGNPHFPAYGALRFYQYRMRIPGVYDAQGVSLIGSPCIQIGFNDHLGWTHTVSKSRHFTLYFLELNPENPLQYKYGEGFKDITRKEFTIQVKQEDGTLQALTRPVYFSHYGPMIMTPELKWDDTVAFTYRDANRHNIAFIDQWLDMGQAKNITQFKKAFEKYRGTPWVNTLYSDDQGNALYIEGTPVPKMSPTALAVWKQNPVAQAIYEKIGAFLFRGSDPEDEWAPEALVPYSEAPQLTRKDYVSNHNDSHWIINENAKLTGFSPIYGPEEVPQTYRTRQGLKMLRENSGADKKFNAREVKESLYSNESYLWHNIGQSLKSRCASWSEPEAQEACQSMQNFEGRYDLDAVGFPAFREVAASWKNTWHQIPFNKEDPANTPSGLAEEVTLADEVKALFLKGAANLKTAGINLSAKLKDLQFFRLPDYQGGTREKISYHGGLHEEGVFNVQDWDGDQHLTSYAYPSIPESEIISKETNLTKEAYSINGGMSFALLVEFPNRAKGSPLRAPRARGLLTYSQSSDPESPYYSDQNRLYVEKKLRHFPHDWREIEARFDDKDHHKVVTDKLPEGMDGL